MSRNPKGVRGTAGGHSSAHLGFTFSETVVVVYLISVLTAILLSSVQNNIEQAKMASCMIELRGIQAALWSDIDGGEGLIDPEKFWETHYAGTKPGPYVLLVNHWQTGGPPQSAGADGQGNPSFVVVGRHKHWPSGKYVFIVDDMPPQIVTGADGDPGYGGYVDWESGRELGAKSAGASASANHFSWARSESAGTSGPSGSSGGDSWNNGLADSLASTSGATSSTDSGRTTTSRIGD